MKRVPQQAGAKPNAKPPAKPPAKPAAKPRTKPAAPKPGPSKSQSQAKVATSSTGAKSQPPSGRTTTKPAAPSKPSPPSKDAPKKALPSKPAPSSSTKAPSSQPKKPTGPPKAVPSQGSIKRAPSQQKSITGPSTQKAPVKPAQASKPVNVKSQPSQERKGSEAPQAETGMGKKATDAEDSTEMNKPSMMRLRSATFKKDSFDLPFLNRDGGQEKTNGHSKPPPTTENGRHDRPPSSESMSAEPPSPMASDVDEMLEDMKSTGGDSKESEEDEDDSDEEVDETEEDESEDDDSQKAQSEQEKEIEVKIDNSKPIQKSNQQPAKVTNQPVQRQLTQTRPKPEAPPAPIKPVKKEESEEEEDESEDESEESEEESEDEESDEEESSEESEEDDDEDDEMDRLRAKMNQRKDLQESKDQELKPPASNSMARASVDSFMMFSESQANSILKETITLSAAQLTARNKELLEIIKLNRMNFSLYDVPPLNYDVFIKCFGRKDAKQKAIQTIERHEAESQTEPITFTNKWVQNPSLSSKVSGGDQDGRGDNRERLLEAAKADPLKMTRFVSFAENVMLRLLATNRKTASAKRRHTPIPSEAREFAERSMTLPCPALCAKSKIYQVFSNKNYVFTVHNVEKIPGAAEKSVISMWSLEACGNKPEKTFIARSHISSALADDSFIIIGGLIDGSVAIWNASEEPHLHKTMTIDNMTWTLRSPSYNSAGTDAVHESQIVDMRLLKSDNEERMSLTDFASLDQAGNLILWSVKVDRTSTLTDDLGQSPMASLKLVKIQTIKVKSATKDPYFETLCFDYHESDMTQFFVGTNDSKVIRVSKYSNEEHVGPMTYESEVAIPGCAVNQVRFLPKTRHFLAAYEYGQIALFSIESPNPLHHFIFKPNICSSVIELITFMGGFLVLYVNRCIAWWQLDHKIKGPKFEYSDSLAVSISLKSTGASQYLVIGREDGKVTALQLKRDALVSTDDRSRRRSSAFHMYEDFKPLVPLAS